MIVVVLGMHRAGTSMLSSMLHAAGVSMGPEDHLHKSNPNSQPLGYWEDQDFTQLNRRIIKEAGGHWHKPPPCQKIIMAGLALENEIRWLIEKRREAHRQAGLDQPLWGWKDPRNCLTIECYQKQLLRLNTRYIHIKRGRAAIVDSLIRRGEQLGGADDQRAALGELVDLHEQRLKNFYIRHNPQRLTVTYEALTNRQQAALEVDRIADFLSLPPGAGDKMLSKIVFRGGD